VRSAERRQFRQRAKGKRKIAIATVYLIEGLKREASEPVQLTILARFARRERIVTLKTRAEDFVEDDRRVIPLVKKFSRG
jgi:hypothetical protein